MKMGKVYVLSVALLLFSSALVVAVAKPPTVLSPVMKFGKGAVHTVASPLEVPISVSKVSKTYGPFWGISVGPVNGVLAMVERGLAGAIDVLTFYVPAWDQPVLPKHPFGETELTNPYEPAVRVGY